MVVVVGRRAKLYLWTASADGEGTATCVACGWVGGWVGVGEGGQMVRHVNKGVLHVCVARAGGPRA